MSRTPTTLEDIPRLIHRLQWRTRISTGLALVALVGGGAVTAYAAIPSPSTNLITACVTGIGTTRIVDTDAGQNCLVTEKKVQWGGGTRDVHWVNIDANGNIAASSDPKLLFFDYNPATAASTLAFYGVIDTTKCALTGAVSDLSFRHAGYNNVPVIVTVDSEGAAVIVRVRRTDNGQDATHMPYTVVVDCTHR